MPVIHKCYRLEAMLKILHVYKDYHPILGGIENHIKTLAELQARAGHEVTVLVTNPGRLPANEMRNGVRLVRARRLATVASTPLSLTLPWQLRGQAADITHLHFPYPVGEMSQWLAGRGRSYVITYHSDVVKQQGILRFYRPVMQRVLRGAGRIIATSEAYIASSPYLKPLAGQCTVVPLSVNARPFMEATPLFPPAGPGEPPVLLFAGRHRYYKGLDTLIRAMPRLDACLLVGGDGPMRPVWEALVAELGVGEKVRFVGEVSDEALPGLYASADIFVLPANSRAEAFGKVLLEAMAAGLPCVTTEVGTGTSLVVQDGVTGRVVPPQDPEALAAALRPLLADGGLRRRMGEAGRERVLREFTPEQMVERVEAVYRAVLGGP